MKNQIISFYHKGRANTPLLEINNVKFYFSYQTCIGVIFNGEAYTHVNDWNNTTGQHLNAIETAHNLNKADRLERNAFQLKIFAAMKAANIEEMPKIS
jgi:hypothetical protein